MKIAYFPGCLLADVAGTYDASLRECVKLLGDECVDFEWHCCGGACFGPPGAVQKRALVDALFAKAVATGADSLLVPCPYCMDNLRLHTEKPPIKLLSTFNYLTASHRAGVIAKQGSGALKGLKAAFFPGCRSAVADADFFNPLKSLLEKLGVEVLDWDYKELCCGGWRTEPLTFEALKHFTTVFEKAREAEANAIITACPVCQVSLDLHLTRAEQHLHYGLELPTFFVTELVGQALGARSALKWYRRHISSPQPLVETLVEQAFMNGVQKDE